MLKDYKVFLKPLDLIYAFYLLKILNLTNLEDLVHTFFLVIFLLSKTLVYAPGRSRTAVIRLSSEHSTVKLQASFFYFFFFYFSVRVYGFVVQLDRMLDCGSADGSSNLPRAKRIFLFSLLIMVTF